jgi:hypothetical protein
MGCESPGGFFGAIHFYTQYFERLGAPPGTILVAGIVALGIALAIVRYSKDVQGRLRWQRSTLA